MFRICRLEFWFDIGLVVVTNVMAVLNIEYELKNQ